MRDNTIKKTTIKIAYFFGLLIISIFVISKLSNIDKADMTAKMSPASLPVITMQSGDKEVNPLHGYLSEVNANYVRGTVWPINSDRTMSFKINTFGQKISNVGFELRNIGKDNRLIADEDQTEFKEHENTIDCKIQLAPVADLILAGREYMLVIKVELNNAVAKYYTRIVWTEGDETRYNIDNEIDFITGFSEATFDKERAKAEYAKYLETDKDKEKNDTFSRVNLHSSFDQVTWGSLLDKSLADNKSKSATVFGKDKDKEEAVDVRITDHTKPQIYVNDIQSDIGTYKLQYRVTTQEGEDSRLYNVTEVYRVKWTKKRPFILNFERKMNCIFDTSSYSVGKNSITLGICSPDFEFKESGGVSEGGSVFAFVSENRLFSYNNVDGRLAYIFGFYDKENDDIRANWDNNEVKILNVDEDGDVRFVVAGYMNRGIHEGRVGIAVYNYSASLNAVEEQAFIECGQAAEIVEDCVETLAYVNDSNTFYIMLDQNIYEVNLTDRTYNLVVEDIGEGSYKISESEGTIAWQGDDLTRFDVMNLDTKIKEEITAENGEKVILMGFRGEDFVYGFVRAEDEAKDQLGNPLYLMHRIQVHNMSAMQEGSKPLDDREVPSEYGYVTGIKKIGKQINFYCVKKNENGEYESTDELGMEHEYVFNYTQEDKAVRNKVTQVAVDEYEKIVQIGTKNEVKPNQIKVLTPNQILFEESRNVDVELKRDAGKNPFYYVYDMKGKAKVYTDSAKAVKDAELNSGAVVGDTNNYIWRKGDRLSQNRIVSLTEKIENYEGITTKNPTAVCIDLILYHYGGRNMDVESSLASGNSVEDILKAQFTDANIVRLDGCTLDTVLYYISKGLPIMAFLENDDAVLLLGYDSQNIDYLDPRLGKIQKLGMTDAKDLFAKNGNHFITYVPNEK